MSTRIQTGILLETSLLAVLKAYAGDAGMGLGRLIEQIVAASFEGRCHFDSAGLAAVRRLREAHGMALTAAHSHQMSEEQFPRVQTGVRLDARLVKVLKGLAAYLDRTLGDIVEGITLHAFEGRAPFEAKTLRKIELLSEVYELELTDL